MKKETQYNSILSKKPSVASEEVKKKYDELAVEYNESLKGWGYTTPQYAAEIFHKYVPVENSIIDACCGTGLCGIELFNKGYSNITGVDISLESLEIAKKTNAYQNIYEMDLQQYPLSFKDNEFDALNCIGALTYFKDTFILAEFCRIVKSGGYAVFSQRDDLYESLNYDSELSKIKQWEQVFISEPLKYLPKHPVYADNINVILMVYKVS